MAGNMDDATSAIANAILKNKELYEDALQPAVQQFGKAAGTIAGLLNTCLAPLRVLNEVTEMKCEALIAEIMDRSREIPVERQLPPAAYVAGPIMQSLLWAADEHDLKELYLRLILTTMDTCTVKFAHPAFCEVIKQLTPDEARIVCLFGEHKTFPLISLGFTRKNEDHVWDYLQAVTLIPDMARCVVPSAIDTYISNLERLGLLQVRQRAALNELNRYNDLENTGQIADFVLECSNSGGSPILTRGYLVVTPFGEQFHLACVGQPSPLKKGEEWLDPSRAPDA